MESLCCHGNADVNETWITTNFHLSYNEDVKVFGGTTLSTKYWLRIGRLRENLRMI